jgi:hypothetical protein
MTSFGLLQLMLSASLPGRMSISTVIAAMAIVATHKSNPTIAQFAKIPRFINYLLCRGEGSYEL